MKIKHKTISGEGECSRTAQAESSVEDVRDRLAGLLSEEALENALGVVRPPGRQHPTVVLEDRERAVGGVDGLQDRGHEAAFREEGSRSTARQACVTGAAYQRCAMR